MRYSIARCPDCRWWPYFVLDLRDPWQHLKIKHGELYAPPSEIVAPPLESPSAQLHNLLKSQQAKAAPTGARDTSRPPPLSVLDDIREESG